MLLISLAFGASAQIPPNRLAGTSWRLVRFQTSDGKTITADDPSKYTIAFGANGRASIRIDCNRGRGAWKSSAAGALEFGPLALTRAMCPHAALTDRLPGDMSSVRSYTIRNGHLFLSLMGDGGVYEFEPIAEPGSIAQLENTEWTLTSLGETHVTAASPGQAPRIALDQASHRVTGSGGCNRITGSYELNGNRLRFSRMAATLMACAAGMDTEKEFLHALEQVRTWKISGRQLEFDDKDGHAVAGFEARKAK
jgi:heat shock protein HslJ